MPLYIADYLADTSHLTTVEHGAYLLLLMHYWRAGKLPANAEQLARVCRQQKSEFDAIKPTLEALFDTSGGSWKHRRVEVELQKTAEISEKRSIAGRKGQQASAENRKRQLPTQSQSHSQVEEKETLSGFQKETTVVEIIPPKKPNGGGKRGIRLPDDWTPDDELIGWAMRESADLMMVERETAKFCDYWRGRPGAGGVKLDWDATFRNWIRKALDDGRARSPHERLTGAAAVAAEYARRNAG